MDRIRRLDLESWLEDDWDDPNVKVVHSGDADPAVARRAWEELTAASQGVWRLSVRRDNPHLEVHLVPPDTASVLAERLVEAFRNLGASVARKS
jgi:hypothetical protein